MTLSVWVREVLLRQQNPEPGQSADSPNDETVLAEVLGLRTILLNVLFGITNGEKLTADEMQKLIEKADQQGAEGAGKAGRENQWSPEWQPGGWAMNRRPKGWPSPVWWATLGAGVFGVLFIVFGLWLDYARDWTFLEKFYLQMYVKTWVADINPIPHKAQSRYQLLEAMPKKDKQRLALPGEVEEGTDADGKLIYVLTDQGREAGLVRLIFPASISQAPCVRHTVEKQSFQQFVNSTPSL